MKMPSTPQTYGELIEKYLTSKHLASRFVRAATAGTRACVDGRYVHWDKLAYLEPPSDLSREEWWLGIKLARQKLWNEIALRDVSGRPFKFAMPDEAHAIAHEITQNASGSIAVSEQVVNPDTRERYIVSSLIEEAVTSSQLEGAATTTPVAKEMIRSGREPRDESERMILNNYRAIREIRGLATEPQSPASLSPALVFKIHKMMTEQTLSDPDAEGRLRLNSERRVVMSAQGQVLHEPPPASQLEQRMQGMCDFANDRETYMNPVARAILLHLWLAYDHPFVDGNGRTARALFYWSMLSQGYWLCEYISISRILKEAPAKYARSFLYTESDENDATYFLLSQLRVVQRAIEEMHVYLRRKAREVADTERLLRKQVEFNHRQIALLAHGLRHPGMKYTIRTHQNSHNVVYETARSDLLDLANKGLLAKRKFGRTFAFVAPDDLSDRLAKS